MNFEGINRLQLINAFFVGFYATLMPTSEFFNYKVTQVVDMCYVVIRDATDLGRNWAKL